jgi:hypothetical protein
MEEPPVHSSTSTLNCCLHRWHSTYLPTSSSGMVGIKKNVKSVLHPSVKRAHSARKKDNATCRSFA